MSQKFKKIGCISDFTSKVATDSFNRLMKQYKLVDVNSLDVDCDALVVLGGDGMMLKVLHRFLEKNIPIYGMNRGSVGFLMNPYNEDNLLERLSNAVSVTLHPLEMKVIASNGEKHTALAINEVSLLRETNQAAKIRISVDDQERLDCLVCDGILVSTPAGSTAYNFAANGPIVPLDSNILPLTPISPFRPRRWRGALLSNNNKINFEIINPEKRPVSAVADFTEFRDVRSVKVQERKDINLKLLFDKKDSIAERIIQEQFLP
jgi:NAD+ kinase